METAGTRRELEGIGTRQQGFGGAGKAPSPWESSLKKRVLLPKFQSWLCYLVAV